MNIILISSLVVASSIIMARKHGKAIIVTMTMTTTSVVPRKSTTRFVTCGHWHRLCIHSIYRCEAHYGVAEPDVEWNAPKLNSLLGQWQSV